VITRLRGLFTFDLLIRCVLVFSVIGSLSMRRADFSGKSLLIPSTSEQCERHAIEKHSSR